MARGPYDETTRRAASVATVESRDDVTRRLIGSLFETATEARDKGMLPALKAERALLAHLGILPGNPDDQARGDEAMAGVRN